MAAVTQTISPRYNVSGSFREQFYSLSGADTNTLKVGLNTINQVVIEPSTITGYSVASNGPGSGSTITFSASGAFTAVQVTVIGH